MNMQVSSPTEGDMNLRNMSGVFDTNGAEHA